MRHSRSSTHRSTHRSAVRRWNANGPRFAGSPHAHCAFCGASFATRNGARVVRRDGTVSFVCPKHAHLVAGDTTEVV